MVEGRPRSRIALIGAGAWGINHLRVLLAEPSCQLATVVDCDLTARERARSLIGSGSVEEVARSAFHDPKIDAVVIATPGPTHADLVCAALQANKHVLVEKPLAMSLVDAMRVAEAARRSDRLLMIGHLMVFHPAIVRLRELLDSGELGPMQYVYSIRANMGRIRADENALWSFGPHELSILDFLFDRSPVDVTARGQCIVHSTVHDVVFLTLRYDSGETIQLHLSRMHPRKERRFTLICAKKMVEFDDVGSDKLRIYDKGDDRPQAFTEFAEYLTISDGDVYIPKLSLAEPLRIQLRHFLDCIAGTHTPRSDISRALRITAALEAAQRSLDRDGAPVRIERV